MKILFDLVLLFFLLLLLNHKNHMNMMMLIFMGSILSGLMMVEFMNYGYMLMMIVFVGGIMVLMMFTVMMSSNLILEIKLSVFSVGFLFFLLLFDWTPQVGSMMNNVMLLDSSILLMMIIYLFIVMVGCYNLMNSNKSLNVYS